MKYVAYIIWMIITLAIVVSVIGILFLMAFGEDWLKIGDKILES